MTEQEWLACDDAQRLLRTLREPTSERKLRLFAVACCRSIDHLICSRLYRDAIVIAERFADAQATDSELTHIHALCDGGVYESDSKDFYVQLAAIGVTKHAEMELFLSPAFRAAVASLISANDALSAWADKSGGEAAGRTMCKALESVEVSRFRCIFGNPFRPVSLDPSWLTSDVVALARCIYDDRAFDRMPILADALQDAGCDNADVLNHCRGDSVHARGCWVVDLLLGKM